MENAKYPGYVLRHTAGMWTLLDLTHPDIQYIKPLTLNESGAQVWKWLDEGMGAEEIAERVSAEFSVSYDKVLSDVNVIIGKFIEYGIPIGK